MKKEIIVKINGKPYPTFIDETGLQRFKPNSLINCLHLFFVKKKRDGLDELHTLYESGVITQMEFAEYFIGLGYPIYMLEEKHCFESLIIENPYKKKVK